MKCTKCGADCRCLAGESAHPDNWFCPQCDRIEALKTEVQRLQDSHLERTKLTTRVINERDALKAQLKEVDDFFYLIRNHESDTLSTQWVVDMLVTNHRRK
jgi:hypothetical protein